MAPSNWHLWYGITSLVLAAALFFPVSRLLWVWRVRLLERRLKRQSTAAERHVELRRARLIGGVIALTVAFLFNRMLMGSG
jgi:hypothetical protein